MYMFFSFCWVFFPCRGCEECFEASADAKGYECSCKNIRPGLPPMQQALCVCVSKTDPAAAIPSPYPATTPPPHPTHTATLCEVWLCRRYQKGCKCSSGHSARPSNCCHVAGTMCSPLFWELCFNVQEGTRSYWDSKEINRIDSSLAEITLAFALYQILFCPKGAKVFLLPDKLILNYTTLMWKRWADQNNNQMEKALKRYWEHEIF